MGLRCRYLATSAKLLECNELRSITRSEKTYLPKNDSATFSAHGKNPRLLWLTDQAKAGYSILKWNQSLSVAFLQVMYMNDSFSGLGREEMSGIDGQAILLGRALLEGGFESRRWPELLNEYPYILVGRMGDRLLWAGYRSNIPLYEHLVFRKTEFEHGKPLRGRGSLEETLDLFRYRKRAWLRAGTPKWFCASDSCHASMMERAQMFRLQGRLLAAR